MKIPEKELKNIPVANTDILKYGEKWKNKYVSPELLYKDWSLVLEEYKTNGVGREIFVFPCFTEKYCNDIINLAEGLNNWSCARHQNYPTYDIELEWVGAEESFLQFMSEYIYHVSMYALKMGEWEEETTRIVRDYKNNPATLIAETFLVKYDAEALSKKENHTDYGDCKMSFLPTHIDDSIVSLLIPLNDNYVGGGTKFPKQDVTLKPPAGSCILFPGGVTHPHGARLVTKGVRYVIALFINIVNQNGDGFDWTGKLLAKNSRVSDEKVYKGVRDRNRTED